MAQVTLKNPFDAFHGALAPRGIVNRKKTYKIRNSRGVAEGQQEAYAIKHPRDYKTDPPKGEELRNINCWTEASNRAAQLIALEKNGGIIPEELLKHYQYRNVPIYYVWEEAEPLLQAFHARFESQFPGKRGSRPDIESPIDKTTHRPKRYIHFPSFLRAVLYRTLKSN